MSYLYHPTYLSDIENEIYFALLHGLLRCEKQIRVPKADAQTLMRVFEAVCLDQPSFFHLGSFKMQLRRGEDTLALLPEYLFSGKEQTVLAASLEKRIDRILSPLRSLPDEEKIEAIHAFILSSVRYDKVKKNYSHQILGVLHHGIGVCEGIAKTVKCFCDALDIDCIIALGTPPGSATRHAWNLIRTDDWKSYDFTFDLSASRNDYACHRFFGLTREEDEAIHGTCEFPLPWKIG